MRSGRGGTTPVQRTQPRIRADERVAAGAGEGAEMTGRTSDGRDTPAWPGDSQPIFLSPDCSALEAVGTEYLP